MSDPRSLVLCSGVFLCPEAAALSADCGSVERRARAHGEPTRRERPEAGEAGISTVWLTGGSALGSGEHEA